MNLGIPDMAKIGSDPLESGSPLFVNAAPNLPLGGFTLDGDSPGAVEAVAKRMAACLNNVRLPHSPIEAAFFIFDVAAAFTAEALKMINSKTGGK